MPSAEIKVNEVAETSPFHKIYIELPGFNCPVFVEGEYYPGTDPDPAGCLHGSDFDITNAWAEVADPENYNPAKLDVMQLPWREIEAEIVRFLDKAGQHN